VVQVSSSHGSLHCVEVGNVADISEVHAAISFRGQRE
jgi:hypothetical protein